MYISPPLLTFWDSHKKGSKDNIAVPHLKSIIMKHTMIDPVTSRFEDVPYTFYVRYDIVSSVDKKYSGYAVPAF